MTLENKFKPPEPNSNDTAHMVAGAIMAFIPGLPELFQYIVAPPFEKRKRQWMEDVGKALHELEQRHDINLEELQNNDVFIDTVLHATQIALRNSQEEKQAALKNAIVNAALPSPPDESMQLMFLHWIDTFTIWHVRILRLFQNPKGWFLQNNKQAPSFSISSSLSQLLIAAYPELSSQRAFYDLVISDLDNKGLFSVGSVHGMMSSSGAFEKRTTLLGDKFLQFIAVQPNIINDKE